MFSLRVILLFSLSISAFIYCCKCLSSNIDSIYSIFSLKSVLFSISIIILNQFRFGRSPCNWILLVLTRKFIKKQKTRIRFNSFLKQSFFFFGKKLKSVYSGQSSLQYEISIIFILLNKLEQIQIYVVHLYKNKYTNMCFYMICFLF